MTREALWRILLVAFSLGLDVLAVSVGIGMREIGAGMKFRIGAAFAAAEVGMTALGAGLGHLIGHLIGESAAYLGFVALIVVGAYMIVETIHETESGFDLSRGWGLFWAALSISLDSLGIGFSIMYIGVPFGLSLVVIAGASMLCCGTGLTFGRLLGRRAEEWSGTAAGVVLILTGLTFAALRYFHIG